MKFVWIYNHLTGAVQRWPELQAALLLRLPGWHGPFATKETALDFYQSHKQSNPGWVAPTGIIGNVLAPVTTPVKEIFGGVDLQAWLIRIGEIVLGIVLIAVGIMKLSTDVSQPIAKAVGKAAKAFI